MALIVPYRSNGAGRAMMETALTSYGSRAHGMAFAPPRRTIQPVTRRFSDLCCLSCAEPAAVGYEAAKRAPLGSLGASNVVTYGRQAYTGVATGAAVSSIATSVGVSAASAIGAGAAAGSVVPIIGTAIGAIVGLVASGVLNHRTDPEVANFNQAVGLYQQNQMSVLNIANKYLVLAGLFDLLPGQIKGNIPMYKKYGRLGEFRFVTDMMTRIYQAGQSGQITASDTPLTIMSNIVQPWINGFGFGPMTDSNADMINLILIGMIADYITGNQRVWSARGGDFPFASLPAFALPVAAAPPARQIAQPQCSPPYVWNGSQCVLPNAAPTSVVQQTDDQVLASQGWQRVGTDAAGHGLYSKPTAPGQIFSWTNGNLVPTNVYGPGNPAPGQLGAASCSPPYVWNGTQCVLPNNAIPPDLGAAQGAVWHGPPSGFSQVGADASGVPIYANPQGVLYQWNGSPGSGMQLFSGQLATGSSSAAQMQAAIQNALAQGQSAQQAAAAALQQAQSAGVAVTPQLQQQVAAQTQATQAAPIQATQAAPIAAGAGGGLSLATTASVLSITAAVVGLLLATAHPARGSRRSRRRA